MSNVPVRKSGMSKCFTRIFGSIISLRVQGENENRALLNWIPFILARSYEHLTDPSKPVGSKD